MLGLNLKFSFSFKFHAKSLWFLNHLSSSMHLSVCTMNNFVFILVDSSAQWSSFAYFFRHLPLIDCPFFPLKGVLGEGILSPRRELRAVNSGVSNSWSMVREGNTGSRKAHLLGSVDSLHCRKRNSHGKDKVGPFLSGAQNRGSSCFDLMVNTTVLFWFFVVVVDVFWVFLETFLL